MKSRYVSFGLALTIILLYCFNINRLVLDYREVSADELVTPIDGSVGMDEHNDTVTKGELYEGLKSIKDVIITGDLDAVDISFSQPVINEKGQVAKEGDDKKVFFFGDTDSNPIENNWSEWDVGVDGTVPQPSTIENSPNTPIEVTFDRFLEGE